MKISTFGLRLAKLLLLVAVAPDCGGGGGGFAGDRYAYGSVDFYPGRVLSGLSRTDLLTGLQTPISGFGLLGAIPAHLAYVPTSDSLIGRSESGLWRISLATGLISAGPAINGLAASPLLTYDPGAGVLLTIANGSLHSIHPVTGVTSIAAPGIISDSIAGIAYDPAAGVVYAVTNQITMPMTPPIPGKFLKINRTTGAVTQAGSLAFPALADLAFDSGTNTLYAVNGGTQLYSLSLTDGTPTLKGTTTAVFGLEFDSSRGLLWGSDPTAARLSTIIPSTGASTPSWDLGFKLRALACTVAGTTLFGVDGNKGTLVSVDRTAGNATAVGAVGFVQISDLALNAIGALYGYSTATHQLILINTTTGTGSAVHTPGTANIVGIEFVGGTLYGIDGTANTLVTINSSTGAIAAGPALGVTGLHDLSVNGSGQLFALGSTGNLYQINASTGAATLIGTTGLPGPDALAFDAGASQFWSVDASSETLMKVDPISAKATAVGSFGFWALSGLAFDHAAGGNLYGVVSTSNNLVVIDPATGEGRFIGKLSGPQVQAITFHSAAQKLYAVDTSNLMSINPSTAGSTTLGPLGGLTIRSLAFHESTSKLYGIDSLGHQLLELNQVSGAATVIGPLAPGISSLAYAPLQGVILGFNGPVVYLVDTSTGGSTLVTTTTGLGGSPAIP